MSFITRAMGVVTQPKNELPRAAAEPSTTGGLIGGYAAILAALPSLGALLGVVLLAGAALGYIIGPTLVGLVLTYLLRDLGLTIGIGFAAAALAPSFGGQNNTVNGIKLAVYAATPIWILGFIGALLMGLAPQLAALNWLFIIAGFAYAGYIIYLGARPLLGVTEQQAPVIAAILTIGWLVLYFVVNMIITNIIFSSMMSSAVRGYGY